jgi:hypothetical protein
MAVLLRGAEHLTPTDEVWLLKGMIKTGAASPEMAVTAVRDYVRVSSTRISSAKRRCRRGGNFRTIPALKWSPRNSRSAASSESSTGRHLAVANAGNNDVTVLLNTST